MLSHCSGRQRAREAVRASLRCRMKISSVPAAPFRHLLRLTDNIGVLEHADGTVPRYEHGYCVDDVARGLVVVCREPSPRHELVTLGRRYLYFLAQAQAPDGRFRNRLGYDRRWRGDPGTQDCWGRALWALGTAAARGPTAGIREEALARFGSGARVGLRGRTPWRSPRSVPPRCSTYRPATRRAVAPRQRRRRYRRAARDAAWPWPAPRLSYANAAIAEAVIVAGAKLGEDDLLRNGLRMLEWLLAGETRNGHLSVVPAGGWGPGEARPGFDQQPIEVAALADACARAATVTGDSSWLTAWACAWRGSSATTTPDRAAQRADRRRPRRPRARRSQSQPGSGVDPGDDLRAPAGS